MNAWMRHAICIYEHYQGILHQYMLYNHNGYNIFCNVCIYLNALAFWNKCVLVGYITTKQRIIHDSCTKQVLMYPILWIAFGWWHNNAFLSSLLAWVLHIVTCTWVLTWPHYSFLLVHWPLLWVVTFIASRFLAIMIWSTLSIIFIMLVVFKMIYLI